MSNLRLILDLERDGPVSLCVCRSTPGKDSYWSCDYVPILWANNDCKRVGD